MQDDQAPGAPAPVIVIEYRPRGLVARLMPPALILVTALAASSYQRWTPLRPIAVRVNPAAPGAREPAGANGNAPPPRVVFRPSGAAPAAVATPAPSPAADVPKPPAVAAVPVEPAPAGPPETVAALFDLGPVPGLEPLAETRASDAGAGAPPAADSDPSPEPDPVGGLAGGEGVPPPGADAGAVAAVAGPSRDEVLRDIQREAEADRARRADLEKVKTKAEALLQNEAVERVREGRTAFRDELRLILAAPGPDAGAEIDRLCDQHGRDPVPRARAAFERFRRSGARVGLADTVGYMRLIGLSEATILDYIAHTLHKTINSPGGPRDPNEVRVRAARMLLSLPVTARRPAAPPTAARSR